MNQSKFIHFKKIYATISCWQLKLKINYIVKWGNDGTKITNLSVMFHRSFTTMWHHFNPQMQNFIDNFHVPSSVYRSLYMRNYWKTSPIITPLIGEMLGHTKGKVGTAPHLYPMIYAFLWGKEGSQKNYWL